MKAMKFMLGALVVLMALGGMATAAPATGATTVTVGVEPWITIAAPASLDLGNLVAPGVTGQAIGGVTVTSNQPDQSTTGKPIWALDAAWTSTQWLQSALTVDNLAIAPGVYYDTDRSSGHLTEAVATGAVTVPVKVSQPVATNEVAGSYTGTIDFTASIL